MGREGASTHWSQKKKSRLGPNGALELEPKHHKSWIGDHSALGLPSCTTAGDTERNCCSFTTLHASFNYFSSTLSHLHGLDPTTDIATAIENHHQRKHLQVSVSSWVISKYLLSP